MLISHAHKFIFIHIYKNAGSSINTALADYCYLNHQQRFFKYTGIKKFKDRWDFEQHVKARELRLLTGKKIWDSYLKFGVVRNPWDWQVSLYHYILMDTSHYDHNLIKSFKTFDNYLKWRVSGNFETQLEFLTDEKNKIIVDKVLKYESINEGFSRLCDDLNIEATLPHRNKSNHDNYKTYYSRHTKELLKDAFKTDIEFFNYRF